MTHIRHVQAHTQTMHLHLFTHLRTFSSQPKQATLIYLISLDKNKKQTRMSSLQSPPAIAITSLVLFFLTVLLPHTTTLSQNPGTLPSSGQTIADCGPPRLMPLFPCAPFVQGTVPSPAQPCCDNLKQLYNQQPSCLCLLLNDTALSSFPINTTLARQLPLFCNLQADTSTCSGGVPLPSSSPPSQVSSGTQPNSTVAASPMVTVAPRPSIMGFGFGRSDGTYLKINGHLVLLLLLAAIAFMSPEVLLSPA